MYATQRKQTAVSIIEFACALVILIPVVLIIMDGIIVILAIETNNQTCTDAARIAANNTPDAALQQAQSVISTPTEERNPKATDVYLESVVNDLDPVELQKSKLYGGPISGTVTVTTTTRAKPMFLQCLQQYLIFKSTATFPYTYVMPAPASTH